jgi:hypothetical protein
MDTSTPADPQGQDDRTGTVRRELAADPGSARHAREAVRQALAAWGIDDPDRDTELLAF